MPEIGPYYAQDSMYYRTPDQLIAEFEEYNGVKLPTKKEVCPECGGKGTMVNRSIDGNGLSPDDPDLDEDFWDDYRSGVYNVRCDECRGNNVIDVVDEDALTPELREAWDDWQRSQHEMVQEHLSELRFGA